MIFKVEENILTWIQKNIMWIALGMAVLINIAIRVSLKDFSSSDFETALNPWYEYYLANGFAGLSTGIGDYTKPYQFMILCFAKLGIPSMAAYKISSGIFDYLLAGAVAKLAYEAVDTNKANRAALSFILVIMSPLVLLDSAAWAQCDAMYVFFVVAAFIALGKDKNLLSFVLLGLGFAVKIQTIFILPFYALYYVVKKKFSIIYFGIIPVVMMICALPATIAGASPFAIFTDYSAQANKFTRFTLNYPTFWQILNDGQTVDSLETLKTMAIFTTVIVLGCFMFYWIYSGVEFTKRNMLYMAFILSYSMVLFLPLMHERYGFLYEILAIAILFYKRKTAPLYVGLILISLQTYGCFLYDAYINIQLVALFNVIVYVAYVFVLTKEMIRDDSI